MSETNKKYYCKTCNRSNIETKFYNYLNTKCIECKIKSVKDAKKIKKDDKISELISGIYLIEIGKVNDYTDKFIFSKDCEDNDYIYKFGITTNLDARFLEHKCDFKKLECGISLVYFKEIIEIKNLLFFENFIKLMFNCEDLCKEFIKKDCNEKSYQELVILNKNYLNDVISFYDKINNKEFTDEYFTTKIYPKIFNNKVKYECNICFETDIQKFYHYLNTKCMICKNKLSKNYLEIKNCEKRKELLNNLDPDNKIRNIIDAYIKQKEIDTKNMKQTINDNKNFIIEQMFHLNENLMTEINKLNAKIDEQQNLLKLFINSKN
jgi:hypothetical protein